MNVVTAAYAANASIGEPRRYPADPVRAWHGVIVSESNDVSCCVGGADRQCGYKSGAFNSDGNDVGTKFGDDFSCCFIIRTSNHNSFVSLHHLSSQAFKASLQVIGPPVARHHN